MVNKMHEKHMKQMHEGLEKFQGVERIEHLRMMDLDEDERIMRKAQHLGNLPMGAEIHSGKFKRMI
jgi:hypothetical protein